MEAKSLELYYANQQLRELNESLERKVLQRTHEIEASRQELIKARDKAEEATRAKSEFLSSMSHEIRTPLNGIMGLTSLLLRDSQDPITQEFAQSIQQAADHLLSLINEILDFSKIEAGKMTLTPEPVALPEWLQQLFNTFAHQAASKQLTLHLQRSPDLPAAVMVDPVKLMQIFTNLIGNALKFTKAGSITIGARPNSPVDAQGEIELYFFVRDTGIGIPEEKLEDIFESFKQAGSSITREYGGTGLGLTITQRLLAMQQGRIEVESQPGQGTTFHVYLRVPVIDRLPAVSYRPRATRPRDLSGLRLLVVDDIKINQVLMRQVLKRVNIDPAIASDGHEAIEQLRQQPFDLVLMDLHMPRLDGISTVKLIRSGEAQALDPTIPILGLTADVFHDVHDQMLAVGFTDIVCKPIDLDQVYEKIMAYVAPSSPA